jgi:8-oxo-dGTP pyrophosphatase MutT (NUDIX family)
LHVFSESEAVIDVEPKIGYSNARVMLYVVSKVTESYSYVPGMLTKQSDPHFGIVCDTLSSSPRTTEEKATQQLAAIEKLLAENKGKPIGQYNLRRAAVSVIVKNSPTGLKLLMVKRARRVDDPWSGQIAFPGGHQKPEDPTILATAIRETVEEVGLDIRSSKILGTLDEIKPVTKPMVVTPFVVHLGTEISLKISEEIDEAFWVDLSFFTDENYVPNAKVRVRGKDLVVPAYVYKGSIIWGMTERIITKFRRSLSNVRK